MREYDGTEHGAPSEEPPEPISPEDFLGHHGIPADARALGLDHNTEEGAMIALAASLNPSRVSHRLVAWVLLVAFAVPLLLGVLRALS